MRKSIPRAIMAALAAWIMVTSIIGAGYLLLVPNLSATPGNPEKSLRLSFAGDIMAHDSNYKMQDFSRIYRRVERLLRQTELNFANLEFVIDNQRPYSTYPRFNVHTEYVAAAIRAGFNVFSLANNHSTDFGLAGVRASEKSIARLQLQYANLTFSGLRSPNSTHDSFAMESILYKGWNIGFTAISILTNSQKGIEALQYIAINDEASLQTFYRWLAQQRQNYDLVIVSVHGGQEYQLQASQRKTQIMRQLARHGADIVWGHHPHVQQPWEVYRDLEAPKQKAARRWALIMYSQGNFISAQTIRTRADQPQGFWAATGDSVLLQVEISRSAKGALVLRKLNPILLTNIRLKPFAFAAVPMADAAAEIHQQGYNGWNNFYLQRQRWLRQRVSQWAAQ